MNALQIVKAMTKERLLQFPKYGPHIHADQQISFIENALRNGSTPTDQEKDHIDIALMAIRELDATEPDYSNALCELSYYFKK